MVGPRWAETWVLASGAQVPLCICQVCASRELSKEET